MRVTPRSLIVDLLSTAPESTLPVRALIAAGEVFELSSNCVRVALCRLREAGTVESVRRGHYRLTERALPLNAYVTAWHRREREMVRWRGRFVAAWGEVTGAEASRLTLLGFATLGPTLRVRPDNLRGGVAALRERARGMGVRREVLIAGLDELDEADADRLVALYDVDGQLDRLRALTARLEASAERLDRLDPHEALRESFVLGGEVIRALVLDPLLPPELCDPAPRKTLAQQMRRYDDENRRRWRDHLETDLARRAPAHGYAEVRA